MEFFDLSLQYSFLKKGINEKINTVLEHGKFIQGPEVEELEINLANYVGAKYCVGVSSGTTSLEIALRALNIGPGDEVITTPFSWISTAEVINLVGAKPVFVDISLDNFNIDPVEIKKSINKNTKAIIPVSLFGQMADLGSIMKISNEYNIPIIEDAAQSFGAKQFDRFSCNVAQISSTSFFPAKPLGCYGDGGALFTNDSKLAEKFRKIRNHGALERHHHDLVGTNGRLDTLQAAILLAKLDTFENEIEKRIEVAKVYNQELNNYCITPITLDDNKHIFSQYTIRVNDRDLLQKNLIKMGVPTAIYYPKCIHLQPAFAYLGYKLSAFPNSEQASNEVLSLPIHPYLTEGEVNRVVVSVKEVLN